VLNVTMPVASEMRKRIGRASTTPVAVVSVFRRVVLSPNSFKKRVALEPPSSIQPRDQRASTYNGCQFRLRVQLTINYNFTLALAFI